MKTFMDIYVKIGRECYRVKEGLKIRRITKFFIFSLMDVTQVYDGKGLKEFTSEEELHTFTQK
jgi:hypothetical protein